MKAAAGSAILAAAFLGACWHWTPAPVNPQPEEGTQNLGHVLVGRCAGDSLELYRAGWRADSLIGVEQLPHTGAGSELARAVPQDSVCNLARRTANVGATVAMTAGITAVVLLFVAILLGGAASAGSGF